MRIKIVKQLMIKELTDVIRDKKTLIAMIGIPILLYPIMMIVMAFGMQLINQEVENDATTILLTGTIPESFQTYLDINESELENVEFVTSIENHENEYTIDFQNNDVVSIAYDSTIEIQGYTVNDIEELFEDYEKYMMKTALEEHSIQVDVLESESLVYRDTASETESIGQLIGQILPMLLLLGVSIGVIYPTIDIVTGEKERNTLETLMSLPITSLEIVTSKFIAIALCGIVSTVLNFFSIGVSMWFLVYSLSQSMGGGDVFSGIEMDQMILPLFITAICFVTFTLFVSALSMVVVSFAKTFKEAQNYITPLMLMTIFPAYITYMPTVKLDYITSFVPVVNIALLVKEMFNFELNVGNIFLVVLSNLVYCVLAIIILGKVFNDESILFGDKKSFKLVEGRSNLETGGVPGTTDGAVLFTVGIVVLFYVGSLLGAVLTSLPLIAISTQILILMMPLLYCYYIKCDFKKTFLLNKFNYIYVLIGIPLTACSFIVTLLGQNVLYWLIPSLKEFAELFSGALDFGSIPLEIAVICIAPAICEELFFRGFLLTSFKVNKYPVIAILVTSVLFGLFHMNLLQFVTGFSLGIVLGFVTYKSKSIYPAIILHFLNNFVAVLISYYI